MTDQGGRHAVLKERGGGKKRNGPRPLSHSFRPSSNSEEEQEKKKRKKKEKKKSRKKEEKGSVPELSFLGGVCVGGGVGWVKWGMGWELGWVGVVVRFIYAVLSQEEHRGSGEDQCACWSVVRAIHRGSQPLWSLCVFPQSVHGVSIYRLYLSPVGLQDGKCRHLLIYVETAIQLTTDVF